MTVILITGACCAAAVAITAYLILRLTKDTGKHVADTLAGAGLIVSAAYEVHHEEYELDPRPYMANLRYRYGDLGDDGPAPFEKELASWEGAPTRPRRAEGTPDQTGLSGGQGGAPTGAPALATAPPGLPGAGTSTPAPGPDVPGRAASAAPAMNNPAGDPPPDGHATAPGGQLLPVTTAAVIAVTTLRHLAVEAADPSHIRWPWDGYSDWHWRSDDTITRMRAISAEVA